MFRIVYWLVYIVLYPIYRFHFYGREHIPEGACLICGNHTSMLDPILLVLALGPAGNYSAMSKAELFQNPLLAALLRWLNAFPVHREKNDIAAIKTALKALKDGRKLIIFPEGTRVKEGEATTAKHGAAMLALRAAAPLLPVYISDEKKTFRKIRVVFGEPILPACAGKPTAEDYARISDSLMRNIKILGEIQR